MGRNCRHWGLRVWLNENDAYKTERHAKKYWIVLFFGFLIVAGLLFTFAQADGVREAVVRDEIASWRVGATDARLPAAVFVSVDQQDPSEGFARRFQGDQPMVYKASQGVQVMPGDIYRQYWVNPATGQRGDLIPLGRIVWGGPFLARVEVDYPTYGSVSVVAKRFSGWKVIQRQQTWMH